ncbi:MAG TPA: hypothetical protein VFO18_15205 [Methylomirabilota bacterium]|nr:hypothetical protein [Methylomirabilota bacterium]
MARRAAPAIALSLLSLPFLLPHVLEDFRLGIAERVGLTPAIGAALLGAFLAFQMFGLVSAALGRSAGLVITALAGTIWTVGSFVEHGPEFLVRGLSFHGSPLSAIWVVGLTLCQAASAIAALIALRSLSPSGRGSG